MTESGPVIRIRKFAETKKKKLVKAARLKFHTVLRNRIVREWVVPVDQPVVWVCQPARSGGTMLIRLFDGHPEVHVRPMPVNFGSHSGWPDDPMSKAESLRDHFSLARFNRRGFSKGASNAAQDQMPIYFDEHWYNAILSDLLHESSSGRQVFDALNTAAFNAWRNYQNLYGPKRQVMLHSVLNPAKPLDIAYDSFFKSYPDGHTLFIARNPDDWLASATKLARSNRHISEMSDALDAYVSYFSALLRSSLDRTIILEFDSLIRDPKANLATVCQELGIRYRDSLEMTTMNRIPLSPNSSHEIPKVFTPALSVLGHGAEIRDEAAKLEQFGRAWELFEQVSALAKQTREDGCNRE